MEEIFVSKGVFIIKRGEVAMGSDMLVNITSDSRVIINPFRAGVDEIASLRIVTVVSTKRLWSP